MNKILDDAEDIKQKITDNEYKKKEELENKIKDINTYWKKLELTYQTELKRREEEYEKNEKEERK